MSLSVSPSLFVFLNRNFEERKNLEIEMGLRFKSLPGLIKVLIVSFSFSKKNKIQTVLLFL